MKPKILRKMIGIWLLVFIWTPVGAASGSSGEAQQLYRIGVSHQALGGINPNDAAAALKAWAAAIPDEQHMNFRIEINLIARSAQDLGMYFRDKELEGVWITVPEMMEMGIAPKAVFMGDRGEDGPEVDYVLLAHGKGSIRSPRDLLGGTLAMGTSERMIMARYWIETVITEDAPDKDACSRVMPVTMETPSKAILQVFFRQVDAAVVTRATYELACELNPQLEKDLFVVAASPPFITTIFFFRPSLYETIDITLVENALLNIHKTVGGRQMLNVIKSGRMEKSPPSVLDGTLGFLAAHERLIPDFLFVEERK